jgi:hypothetical protein
VNPLPNDIDLLAVTARNPSPVDDPLTQLDNQTTPKPKIR